MTPFPSALDGDDLDCALACLNGTCSDGPDLQAHSLSCVIDYAQIQVISNLAGPPVTPCQDVKSELAKCRRHTPSTKTATPIDWSSIIAALLPVLEALLANLFNPTPNPTPTPTPANQGKAKTPVQMMKPSGDCITMWDVKSDLNSGSYFRCKEAVKRGKVGLFPVSGALATGEEIIEA